MSLTLGSLFSGVGGLDLGLERAGMQVRWQVECDSYCQRVLAKHWPHVPRFNDVREVGGGCLEKVDVIGGGFPCQDLSKAGRGAGLAGSRSGLWREFARIVGEIRPGYVIVENVSALIIRGLGTVLGDLAALGYDAQWQCLPAASFGAHHARDRLFLVAYSHRPGVEGPFTGRSAGEAGPWGWRGEEDLRAVARHPFGGNRWPKPLLRRVDDGSACRMDRLRVIGNAVVPQVAEWVGRRVMAHAGRAAIAAHK